MEFVKPLMHFDRTDAQVQASEWYFELAHSAVNLLHVKLSLRTESRRHSPPTSNGRIDKKLQRNKGFVITVSRGSIDLNERDAAFQWIKKDRDPYLYMWSASENTGNDS